ncbi:hypothetical protein yfred0001_13360 [Yersinia frederiksenii ATCC 33641]|nr:hypothetical protein yfred0001_13360 [Yersinia frederiksenii ATCC 33641]
MMAALSITSLDHSAYYGKIDSMIFSRIISILIKTILA